MKSIFIDYNPDFIRYAFTFGGVLKEVIVENKNTESILGNIYVGVVKNILFSGFVFIDIGMHRNVFINITDSKEKSTHIKNGQEILVQIIREASGDKVANATTQLNLTGRYVVLYKNEDCNIGVSKKITSKSEKKRLHEIAENNLPEGFGIIMRTASAHKTEEQIIREICKLTEHFDRIDSVWEYVKPPALLYNENTALRDLLSDEIDEIVINDASKLTYVQSTADDIMGGYKGRVTLYNGALPIFDNFGIESAIAKALEKKVWLKSGGFLFIEQTEACVVIDVNSGKSSGKLSHREIALRINTEAALEISKQIRLRNLSGMIIIDFINMREDSDKHALRKLFSEVLKTDRLPVHIVGMTELGLMQLTRKKTREPLGLLLQRECPYCNGSGMIRR